jgi:hypothetical protein
VPRVLEDLVDRARLDDPAAVHHGHAVGDVADDRQVVRDEEVGESALLLEVEQQVQDLHLHRHVERRHGLVEHDEARTDRQGACDRDPLALAARQLVREAPALLGRQTDALEQLDHARLRRVAARDLVHVEPLADRLAGRPPRIEARERVLEDELQLAAQRPQRALAEREELDRLGLGLAAVPHAPRGSLDQAQQRAPGRRLPAARLPHQREGLARPDLERDAVDGAQLPAARFVTHAQVTHLDPRRAHSLAASSS